MAHDPLRAALATARAPRYTSYPPADRFGAEVGPLRHADWLRAIPEGGAVSLYVHIPFCRRLCWFCACRTQGTRSDAPLDRFLDHLEREIETVRATMPLHLRIAALHLGGGTPTLLSPDRLARLGDMLHRAFPIDGTTEISAEIDPTECDPHRLDALAAMGLGRASVGVQDFDPLVQEAIGRAQGVAATRAAIDGLRARGIGSVNVDLLYGLPHQTTVRLMRTVEHVLDLAPDRLALYGYAHVPWFARRQALIPEDALPDPEARLALFDAARDRLTAAGYEAVGIDHFARPGDAMARAARDGTLRRNFQGYTTDNTPVLVGLGPSSISRFPHGYAQNAAETGAWQQVVAQGGLATKRGHVLSDDDIRIGTAIERLMCDGRLDLATLGHDAEELARRALAALPGAGEIANGQLVLSDPRIARLVAQRLDTGAPGGAARYSQAS